VTSSCPIANDRLGSAVRFQPLGSDGGQGGRVLRGGLRWRPRGEVAGSRRRRGEYAPDLKSVWAAAPLVLVVGGVTAWLVFMLLRDAAVPKRVESCPTCPPQVDTLDVIRTALSVMLFLGALLTGLYAYRKQRLAEGDARRADAQQFADRGPAGGSQLRD
jgi:hypothetical protein